MHSYAVRVRWGDCDPAGIAYTPNILGYAMEAVEQWYRRVMGQNWTELRAARGLLTPTVHASLDCIASMAPDDEILVEPRLIRLGGSSLRFAVAARRGETLLFRASIVSCFADVRAAGAVPIPDDLRALFAAHLEADDGEMLPASAAAE